MRASRYVFFFFSFFFVNFFFSHNLGTTATTWTTMTMAGIRAGAQDTSQVLVGMCFILF